MISRRTMLGLVLAGVFVLPSGSRADGTIVLRLATRNVASGAGSARFTLVNDTTDELAFTTYDGGSVHNEVEHLVAGAWVGVGLGYCGLGADGEVTVAPTARRSVTAYVPAEAGRYRIRLRLERRAPNGTTASEDVVSAPFSVH